MYAFINGPLLWCAFIVFGVGIACRTYQLFWLTRAAERRLFTAQPCSPEQLSRRSPEERRLDRLVAFQQSMLGTHPVMAVTTCVFHASLFIVPVFLAAHNVLLYEAWGVALLSLPDRIADLLTMVLLGCALFFFVRRLTVPRVRSISCLSDYVLLLMVAAPFLTGMLAYRQWLDYRTVLTMHVLSGELMLVAIPFTRIGHMVFFFFVRMLIGSEYSFGRGRRTWAP